MSKKQAHRPASTPTLDVLKTRTEKAIQEGRYQQALDLSKQLCKQDPTPASHDLLREASLGRAQQLRRLGSTRDARTLLDRALELSGQDPALLGRIAEELALAGDVRRALALTKELPGSSVTARLYSLAADQAISRGANGKEFLPQELHAPFALVATVFAQIEAGQDNEARETLQGIGLQSPFLEWRVFLRGLSAYYQGDRARALDNWQRLDPERLPAKLTAPFRYEIDPVFRQAQMPATQAALQKKLDRLQTSGFVVPLRTLQTMLVDPEQLPQAFRLTEQFYPAFRQQHPILAGRLAVCFYWAVVNGGTPEDAVRLSWVFGPVADDPQLLRLRALIFEHLGALQKAHDAWRKYQESLAESPSAWPKEQVERVRALIWCRMGDNAANVPDPDEIPDLPHFLRNHPDRPKPLRPPAAECYENSLELAPDRLKTYESLVQYHVDRGDDPRAARAAERLLERFPDHAPTLQQLGEIRLRGQEYSEAVRLFLQALKAKPLDHGLRHHTGYAYLCNARSLAEAGSFDEARAGYQAALTYGDGEDRASALCKWAACELKAGDERRAKELLKEAEALAGDPLPIAYSMLIEATRLQLPQALKTRFNKQFNACLANPVSARAAVAIACTAAAQSAAEVTYRGQKTHEKKVLVYLEQALKVQLSAADLKAISVALLSMRALTLLRKFTKRGRSLFPANPHFPLLEAESYFTQGPAQCPLWKVRPLLDQAAKLGKELPEGDERKNMLELIEDRRQMLGANGMFSGFPGMDMLNEIFGFQPDYEDMNFDDDD